MKLKKILRMLYAVVYWALFVYLIGLFFIGENTIISNIAFGLYIANILIQISKYIWERISDCKTIKNYKLMFYYLTQSHKQRYFCLLNGDVKGAQEFEDLMKMCSDAILKVGPSIVTYNTITRRQREEVQKIIDKTKVLLTVTQPPV